MLCFGFFFFHFFFVDAMTLAFADQSPMETSEVTRTINDVYDMHFSQPQNDVTSLSLPPSLSPSLSSLSLSHSLSPSLSSLSDSLSLLLN